MGIQLLGLQLQTFESGIRTAAQPHNCNRVEMSVGVRLACVSCGLVIWIGLDAEIMQADQEGNVVIAIAQVEDGQCSHPVIGSLMM